MDGTLINYNYELQERERLFHTIFDNSPDAIFVEDLDGNVLDVNPSACELHGLRRDQLIGKNAAELVPPEYRNSVVPPNSGLDSILSYSVHGYDGHTASGSRHQ
jgi:PAS domain-containing protein